MDYCSAVHLYSSLPPPSAIQCLLQRQTAISGENQRPELQTSLPEKRPGPIHSKADINTGGHYLLL